MDDFLMLCQQKDLPNPGKLWILENLCRNRPILENHPTNPNHQPICSKVLGPLPHVEPQRMPSKKKRKCLGSRYWNPTGHSLQRTQVGWYTHTSCWLPMASPHSPPSELVNRRARTSLVKSSKVNLGSPLGMRTWGYDMAEMVWMNPPNSKLAGCWVFKPGNQLGEIGP